MSFKCEILADSMSPQGDRLTTMKITFPRFILAEFNTHRMFSRNSASSRAIPFKKMLQMVKENPFIPIAWQKDHKGMQGNAYFQDNEFITIEKEFAKHPDVLDVPATHHLREVWLHARDSAVAMASELSKSNATKQLCNRLLEPFMWHTVIVTATEWDNFFKLRAPDYAFHSNEAEFRFKSKSDAIAIFGENENVEYEGGDKLLKDLSDLEWLQLNQSQAEIHIQAIAELMWDAYTENVPKQLEAGEWHIPFGDNFDLANLNSIAYKLGTPPPIVKTVGNVNYIDLTPFKVKVAIARCARISYQTLGDDPKIDYEADLKLYDILSKSGHFSPLEHVARVMTTDEYYSYAAGQGINKYDEEESPIYFEEGQFGWCRNFRGFIQQRALID